MAISYCWESHGKKMASPQSSREFLGLPPGVPGPPQNVDIQILDKNSAMAKWNPPVKNPENVQLYIIRILDRRILRGHGRILVQNLNVYVLGWAR